MTSRRSITVLVAASTLGLAGAARADGLYGVATIGANVQQGDSEPYGDNIAADSDFPDLFDTGDGIAGALGIGFDFDNRFRAETRLGLHRAEFDSRRVGTGARAGEEYVLDGDIGSTTLTVEGFYDFPLSEVFAPYVKAGIGIARNRYSARLGGAGVAEFDPFDGTADGFYDAYADRTSTEFTWNAGLGGDVTLNDRVTLFGEYQYVVFGDVETGQDDFTDGFRADASAHEVQLGVRVDF